MAFVYRVYNFFVVWFVLLLHAEEGTAISWSSQPTTATGIQGQSVAITWVANLGAGEVWDNVRVSQRLTDPVRNERMIKISKDGERTVYDYYTNRNADLNLTATLSGTLLTSVFTLRNLNSSTDAHPYSLLISYDDARGNREVLDSVDLTLTVLVPPTITSPDPSPGSVTVNETQTAQLVCTATGHPAPSYNWTRDGVIVGTGSPFTTPAVTFNDDNACYTCIAYNGILDAKTANVCLNVQYKPRSTLSLVSAKSTVCQNDTVSLTCTSGPAHPAPTSYEFYDNGVLVGTSVSNVYEAKAGVGLPAVNNFVCVPRNLLGPALENASVEVSAKVAPSIVTPPQATTVVEESLLTLFCNASGVPAPNITWSKVGGSIVGNDETYTISNVTRGDEGTYRCTASNGDECSNVTTEAAVVVNYPPENTAISTNQSENTFLKGSSVRLSCVSLSKPQLCNVTFYRGNTVLQSYYDKTCAGAEAASHVIQNIDGCNLEEYSCKVENQYGQQEAKVNLTIKVPPTISTSPAADVILEEGSLLQLNCTAAGCPTPNITWTKIENSASLQSGNGFFLSHRIGSLSKSDTGNYKCSVDNGVVGSPEERTIHVNVTYKPYLTTLNSSKNTACLNDSVTLQCKTDANPPAHEYRFYLNDVLVHTSMSGAYQVNVPQAGNNEYKCEPKNTVGAGQNATVNITVKAPPQITWSTPDQTLVEGERLVLMCNVTGSEPLNVTWSKVSGSSYPEGYSYPFSSIGRGDEATYRCTAHNGNECPVATATSSITVIYKPEKTNLTHNKSSDVFLIGEPVLLTCESQAKPSDCHVLFYQGSQLLANKSSNSCTASHVISSIEGCNDESFSCFAMNEAGAGDKVYKNVTVQVPANMSITPSTDPVIMEEGQALSLNCSATGCPTPNITWTKEGVAASLASENSFFLSYPLNSLTKVNIGRYKCSVDNGVVGSPLERTIYVNVTYKPTSTSLTSPVSNACLNDSVTLQCTTDANPPAYEYRFYLNDVLVYTSVSGVYQLKVPQAGNNEYKCEPVNTVGAGQNATATITAKAPPMITWSTPDQTLVEGERLVLMCNVTGSEPLNVTWSKVGGSSYPEGHSYNFSSIGRGDEATYRCTAHNGNECPVATATSSITVIYKPEKTNITHNKSSDVFVHGEPVKLTCESQAKPSDCHVLFYQGSTLLANKSSSTCTASHVISSIDGCNDESFSCFAMNEAGTGDRAYKNVTVQVPPGASVVPSSDNIVKVEGEALTLSCTPSGCPTPTVTWTKTGESSPLEQDSGVVVLNKTFASLSKQDTGTYQCNVSNGVVGGPAIKTIYLNVTYKPDLTNLTSSLSNACLNDSVTLQCTTDANPPVYEYRFYLNDVLVHTSMSGAYQVKVPQAGNNEYKCEPVNTVGAGQNGTTTVATKAPPQITWSTPDQTLVEGERLVLMCNVTGSEPLNVTWSKVGGSSYPEGYNYTFSSIGRGDEATYRCTAHNGNECPVATATSSITVIYEPENTNLTASIATACKGDSLTLTCDTHAKPAPTSFRFYENDMLIQTQSTYTYTFSLSVSGSNVYKCVPENSAGNGTAANATVIVKAAPVITYVTPTQDVVEGSNLILVCNVTDQSGVLNVSWHKVGGGRVSISNTYPLAPAGRSDTGSYVCKAHNGNECDVQTKNVSITVTYPAVIVSHSNTSVKSNENDQIVLVCRVSGFPTPMINWTRNGQMINNAHGETYTFNGLESLSGNYSCVVGNGVGAVQRKTFSVMIQGFCKDHGCRYGATCRSEGQSYRCLCTIGLTGRYCEIEDPIHTVFDCLLVIEKPEWKPGYAVAKSNDFDVLESMICTKMFLIFNEGPRATQGIILVTCVLISARQGSTYANTELTFNETAARSKVFEAINSGIVNQTVFGNLTLRPSALEVNPKTDPCSSEPCKFNSKCTVHGVGYRCECDEFRYGTHCEKGIGLIPGIIIILACIFILIILIILCVLYCKRRKSETYPAAAAEDGTQMKTYYLPDHEGAAANAQVTTTDEKPPVNGQQQEVYRQNGKEDLIYADLCFKDDANKEKIETLPPEKSETLYADIVSFQQNSEEEPKDAPLAEEAIELTEKKPETTNTETNGSKPTDNEDPEGTGANETSVKPENQYTPSPTKDNLV